MSEIVVEELRRWAEGFRHAADNRHYHLDQVTARSTATRFEGAARQIAELDASNKRLRQAIRAASALLAEGDPAGELRTVTANMVYSDCHHEMPTLQAIAAAIEEAARILGEACPPRPEGREEGS